MEENIIYKIEILQFIESKYNIEIKDEEVENILTLENLIELIKIKQIQFLNI
jgi:acyl carrier protein